MSSIQQQFKLQTSFQIVYSHEHKLYDFTVFDLKTKKVLHHYHYPNLKIINKLIQEYK
jgi:hypothetical protein